MDMQQESLVTIQTFTAPHEAQLAKGQLESCGIEAFVQDDHVVGIQPWYSMAVGGVKLLVFETDRAEALNILSSNVSMVNDSNVETDMCPRCGSPDIGYDRDMGWGRRLVFSLFSLVLIGLPWILRSRTWRCNGCGHSWK